MSQEENDLRQLVDRAKEYDREAFGRLFDMYYDRVYRYAYYKVGNVADAEDIASQTFAGALRTIANFQWRSSTFDSWLFRIAANVAVDTYRKNGRARLEPVEEHLDIASTHDTAEKAISALRMKELRELIDELPEEQGKVLVLRFVCGLSNREVAAAIDKTEGAVKALQFRGLDNLRKLIGELTYD